MELGERIARTYELHCGGQIDLAERQYRALLAEVGAQVDVLYLLSSLLLPTRPGEAADLARQAIDAADGQDGIGVANHALHDHFASCALAASRAPDLRALAAQALSLDAKELPRWFRGVLEPLLKASSYGLPRSAAENATAERLRGELAKSPAQPKHLVAAMFFLFPHELPRIALQEAPAWLQPAFLSYLHVNPKFFPTAEACERHVDFLDDWTRRVAEHATDPAAPPHWKAAGRAYVENALLVPAYFVDRDLTGLFAARGRLLETMMRSVGYRLDHRFAPRRAGRIRVGFLKASWEPQTETFATLPLFEHLDRERFEVVLFAPPVGYSELDAHCRACADRVVVLDGPVPAQAEQVRAADLDLLFFGANLSAGVTPVVSLAAHRLARVQLASICCPATSGLSNIDYFLAGDLTEPAPDAQREYTEKLVRIAGSGICFDYRRQPPPTGFSISRASLGVPDDAVLMVSGSNFYKLGPAVRQAWAEILAAVPQARLVLYPFGPAWSPSYPVNDFLADMHARFERLGVAPERLLLMRQFASIADIPKLLALADLYLDSFPYTGATSVLDPLLADLPPVTMAGRRLRFSQACALLQELGVEELVARDPGDYVALAAALANNPARRAALRARIRERMAAPPPFLDPRRFALKVGAAFERMVGDATPS